MDILTCFGKIAEETDWKITKVDDTLYRVEDAHSCPGIEPYSFEVSDNGNPVTLGAFADRVHSEYTDFDESHATYTRLNSDGYSKVDSSVPLERVYGYIFSMQGRLAEFCRLVFNKYKQLEKNAEFYKKSPTPAECGAHAIKSYLDDDCFPDCDIVDMMYKLSQRVSEYAADNNHAKINSLARTLFGGIFPEEVLKQFDEQDVKQNGES